MIESKFFYDKMIFNNTEFFTGVPDSLLKNFCAYITDTTDEKNHIIAVNEGAAVALASGYHLATGKTALVYMQNSGIGNAVNPLLSLSDSDVYSIPVILVIGWRGAPLVHDEPQHKKQGRVTLDMLDAMQIPYEVLADNEKEAESQIEKAFTHINKCKSPFAFVVKKDTFAPYTLQKEEVFNAEMTREEAIENIMLNFKDSFFVSTTGMASRELYELREKYKNNHNFDFLTVGSMGHASSIALAIAIQKPNIKVVILDGDGAVLMHLGALASIGVIKPNNLIHFVLNNRAHDSVGAQPTIAGKIDLCAFAKDAGYTNVYKADTKEKLCNVLSGAPKINGLSFIEVSVKKGARKDLGRPASSPCENKIAFMNCIKEAK